MAQDEFTKLFKYLQKEFTAVHKKLDEKATKKQVDKLAGAVDGLAKQLTDYHQEFIMLAHKVDRLERWVLQIAEKTGVKLST